MFLRLDMISQPILALLISVPSLESDICVPATLSFSSVAELNLLPQLIAPVLFRLERIISELVDASSFDDNNFCESRSIESLFGESSLDDVTLLPIDILLQTSFAR